MRLSVYTCHLCAPCHVFTTRRDFVFVGVCPVWSGGKGPVGILAPKAHPSSSAALLTHIQYLDRVIRETVLFSGWTTATLAGNNNQSFSGTDLETEQHNGLTYYDHDEINHPSISLSILGFYFPLLGTQQLRAVQFFKQLNHQYLCLHVKTKNL